MPTENLLSLQQKFNNLGPDQLGQSAMTDRYGNSNRNSQAKFQRPSNFGKRSNSFIGKGSNLANTTLTPRAGRRPRLDTSIDVAQQKLDDMMLYNSQKRKSLYTTQKPRVPAPTMYSPQRRR